MRDLGSQITPKASITVAAKTTGTATGTTVDTAQYNGAAVVVHVGTWTDGTHTPSLTDSPDNSTFTAVTAANLIGAFAAITTNGGVGTKQKVTYVGAQRYLRPVIVSSGTTTGAVLGADVILGFPRKLPAA